MDTTDKIWYSFLVVAMIVLLLWLSPECRHERAPGPASLEQLMEPNDLAFIYDGAGALTPSEDEGAAMREEADGVTDEVIESLCRRPEALARLHALLMQDNAIEVE